MRTNYIYKTFDYSIFKIIDENRAVQEKKVQNLIDQIRAKDLSESSPIIINTKYQVLDGQHRLAAWKRLGLPVFYVISNTMNTDDIANFNNASSKWEMEDYIYYYAAKGNYGYKTIIEYSKRWNLPPKTVIYLFAANYRKLKEGSFVITDSKLKAARILYNRLSEVQKYYKYAFYTRFIKAYNKMINTKGYDHAAFMRRLRKYVNRLKKSTDEKEQLAQLSSLYNYNNSKKVQFIITY